MYHSLLLLIGELLVPEREPRGARLGFFLGASVVNSAAPQHVLDLLNDPCDFGLGACAGCKVDQEGLDVLDGLPLNE
jgi:hypothetical protein